MPTNTTFPIPVENWEHKDEETRNKLKQLAKDLFDYGKEYYGEHVPQQITDSVAMIEETVEMFYN
jgi:hypothetical protein